MSQCSFVSGFLGVRGRPSEMSSEKTKMKSDGKFFPDGFAGMNP